MTVQSSVSEKLWIKICATTNLEDALTSIAAGANALGFILAASTRRVTPQTAAAIVASLPGHIEKVGVVVNESPQRLADLADEIGLTTLQLHGDEASEQLPDYRRALPGRKIIKTLQAREFLVEPDKLAGYLRERDSINAILLEAEDTNPRASALYKKAGYECFGRRLLTKSLNPEAGYGVASLRITKSE